MALNQHEQIHAEPTEGWWIAKIPGIIWDYIVSRYNQLVSWLFGSPSETAATDPVPGQTAPHLVFKKPMHVRTKSSTEVIQNQLESTTPKSPPIADEEAIDFIKNKGIDFERGKERLQSMLHWVLTPENHKSEEMKALIQQFIIDFVNKADTLDLSEKEFYVSLFSQLDEQQLILFTRLLPAKTLQQHLKKEHQAASLSDRVSKEIIGARIAIMYREFAPDLASDLFHCPDFWELIATLPSEASSGLQAGLLARLTRHFGKDKLTLASLEEGPKKKVKTERIDYCGQCLRVLIARFEEDDTLKEKLLAITPYQDPVFEVAYQSKLMRLIQLTKEEDRAELQKQFNDATSTDSKTEPKVEEEPVDDPLDDVVLENTGVF